MALENYVKFLRGTPSQYESLVRKDKDTLYFISDTEDSDYGALYLGSKLITSAGWPETATLDSLKDVTLSETGIANGSLLVYNTKSNAWVNRPLDEVLQFVVDVMGGATATRDGVAGLVPAPKAGEQDYFLRGDGTWAKATSNNAQIFEVVLEGEETHEQAIARVIGSTSLSIGDIAIVKETIVDGNYQHTAYVYDGKWKAMGGNYSAENVYFDEDLLTTSAVGVIELVNGQATIPAAGKNLKELFNTMFVKEQKPEVIQPSVSINLDNSGDYEVGKTVKVNYSIDFNPGSYSYGPNPTGVIAESYQVVDGMEVKNGQTGSFADILVTDGMNHKLTALVSHSAGLTPVTNLGNEDLDSKIAAGSVTATSDAIKGYRSFFYGMNSDKEVVYDSDLIRGLTNGKAYNGRKTLKFTATDMKDVKRFIIAIPSASFTGLRTGIASAVIASSMNVDVMDFYNELETTINVKGADNYDVAVPYRVWIYEPTSIAEEEIHEVVLN